MGIASATSLAANQLTAGDPGVGGRGSIEQRGFDTVLTIIARLESTTLSMIDPMVQTSRVWEWETDTLRSPYINAGAAFQPADISAAGPASWTPTARTVLQNYGQIWIRQIVTEGTIRREQTNTGDEHEFQIEQKEAVAMGRDINSSLLWNAGVYGITSASTRIAGGFGAFSGNVYLGGGTGATTQPVYNFQTVQYTQAQSLGAVTAAGTTVGAAQPVNTLINRLNVLQGAAGALGTQVPVQTTAAVQGSGYATTTYTRRLLSNVISNIFDQGGTPTNVVTSPGLRAVFTELQSRAGASDNYRINIESNEEIKNTTSVYVTDFGVRLRIDTEQQLKNYATASGGSPGGVPLLGTAAENTRLILFNPDNIKFSVTTPITRNDDISQPIYGASSALICEGSFVFYNPNDICSIYNLNPDITSAAYPT